MELENIVANTVYLKAREGNYNYNYKTWFLSSFKKVSFMSLWLRERGWGK